MSFGRITNGSEEPFDDFLQSLAHDTSLGNRRFVARNFLLDQGVNPKRQDSYAAAGAMQSHANYGVWGAIHRNNYLLSEVFLSKLVMPTQIDTADRDNCPEPFRDLEAFRRFGAADERLEMIRVEQVQRIAQEARLSSVDELLTIAREFLNDPTSDRAKERLDSVLEVWGRSLDLRPVWAAFWEDLRELFESTHTDWADQLRDQLGLYHLSPDARLREIPVFIFRYPISALPRVRGDRNVRPLAVPTVLDGTFSEAFCPAPATTSCGYVVHLGADYPIRREILHPTIQFRAEHLFRAGTIKRSVSTDLWEARQYHILWIRTQMGYENYAQETDGDLT